MYIDMNTIKISKQKRIVVPVNFNGKLNRFTEQDLQTTFDLVSEQAYPECYGEKLPKSLVYVGRFLIEMKDIDWETKEQNTQTARAGGGNPKHSDIQQDIRENGFKLKHVPISLRRLKNGKLVPLNGRTRRLILLAFKFTNVIVDLYEKNNDYSWTKFDDECSQFGLINNSNNDPAGNLTLEDVYREVKHAIQKGWIDKTIDDISHRVNRVCGDGKFTKQKREELVFRIYNTYSDSKEFKVLSWKQKSAIKKWLETNGYNDTDDVVYYVISWSTPGKGIVGAASTAFENPGKEVRVLVHTSVLTAYNLEMCYVQRIQKFRKKWERILGYISNCFFDNKNRNNNPVKLYAALPALSTLHSLNDIVTFKSIDDEEVKINNKIENLYQHQEMEFEEDEEEFV